MPDAQARAWLAELTLAEKVSLLAGSDLWSLPGVARLGIAPLVMSDGPSGVRGASFVSGRSVCFPCETALGATWDPELVREVGLALGHEARRLGVQVLLAPTVNLHRHPLAGRNFECFSEDPLLSSAMAVAYIAGVQAQGVACCVKHLVCNDSEFERHTISSQVDDTTLHELYLRPFEAAVRGSVWSIMASYNKLNGTHTTENPALLHDVLRDQWGFDGVVVSDWFATWTTAQALAAGLDVEMPGPPRFRGDLLLAALDAGEVSEADVDRSALQVLRLVARTGAEHAVVPADPSAVARRAAAGGMVLLKNDGVLPLSSARVSSARVSTVAVIGPGADLGMAQGGGSSEVNPGQVSAILPALAHALGGVDVRFERGCVTARPLCPPFVTTPDGEPGIRVEYHVCDGDGTPLLVETARQMHVLAVGEFVEGYRNDDVLLRLSADLRPDEAGTYEFVVYGAGAVRLSVDGEVLLERTWDETGLRVFGAELPAHRVRVTMQAGVPRRLAVEFAPRQPEQLTRFLMTVIPPDPPELMSRAVALAAASDVAIVVAESPYGWETEGRDRTSMTLPAGQDALIAAVAAANPNTVVVLNTGTAVTMPWVDDVAAVLAMWFPGQAMGEALADVLTGVVNPSGRLPTTFPRSLDDVASNAYYPGVDGVMAYGERTSIGYRHPRGAPAPRALFPFGHGLSYSTFEVGRPRLVVIGSGEYAEYDVHVPVTHVSGPAGREVVQLYVSSGRADGPARELQGFAAVALGPGESGTAVIRLPRRQLRNWTECGWQIPRGPLVAYVGTSAENLPYDVELPDV